jgi:5-methylcytosine-specific restriction endonuclease McrA
LRDECYVCGCNERRVTDYKTPTLLNFKDGSKSNYVLDNLEILCYNCYFLYVADPLTNDEVRHIETNQTPKAKPFEWDLDDESLSNMKALGLL